MNFLRIAAALHAEALAIPAGSESIVPWAVGLILLTAAIAICLALLSRFPFRAEQNSGVENSLEEDEAIIKSLREPEDPKHFLRQAPEDAADDGLHREAA